MVELKLKNICNFLDYSQLKKIVKRTKTKCEGEIKCKGCFEFLTGLWREKKVVYVDPEANLGHAPPHFIRAPKPLNVILKGDESRAVRPCPRRSNNMGVINMPAPSVSF
jgi:hypothetical protein